MADKRSIAIILGATIGVAAVAAALGVYAWRHDTPDEQDVNDILDKARRAVDNLSKTVEALRRPAA